MKTYEYKVFNLSEATDAKWLEKMNAHGSEGWEVVQSLNKGSFLMVKTTDHDRALVRETVAKVTSLLQNDGKFGSLKTLFGFGS
jgi:hypothetical protein